MRISAEPAPGLLAEITAEEPITLAVERGVKEFPFDKGLPGGVAGFGPHPNVPILLHKIVSNLTPAQKPGNRNFGSSRPVALTQKR